MAKQSLAVLVAEFVRTTPSEIVQRIAFEIQTWSEYTNLNKTKLLSSVHSPQTKSKLMELLDCWTGVYPTVAPQSFALCIHSSLLTYQSSYVPPIELIWTGPDDIAKRFRRTDQALLELVSEATEQLLVVSFAVYKAQAIIDAIEKAILRNVTATICLEDSDETQGKVSLSGSKAFSSSMFKLANFYIWPIDKRPHTHDGKFGSLHAKLAVADRKKVFISSANLTEYAMELNMEMGILIEDQIIGEQITNLFNKMILNSTLRKYP